MAADTSRTIHLKGGKRQEEGIASGTITPGHLIELHQSGGEPRLRVHSVEGGEAEPAVAVEDPLQGKTAFSVESRDRDDNYVANERVTYVILKSGSVAAMFLKAGETVVEGDHLISAGDGTLIQDSSLSTGGTIERRLFVAEQALDLSASGAVDTRVAVRAL